MKKGPGTGNLCVRRGSRRIAAERGDYRERIYRRQLAPSPKGKYIIRKLNSKILENDRCKFKKT